MCQVKNSIFGLSDRTHRRRQSEVSRQRHVARQPVNRSQNKSWSGAKHRNRIYASIYIHGICDSWIEIANFSMRSWLIGSWSPLTRVRASVSRFETRTLHANANSSTYVRMVAHAAFCVCSLQWFSEFSLVEGSLYLQLILRARGITCTQCLLKLCKFDCYMKLNSV